MADYDLFECDECGFQFERWMSIGGPGQVFCPQCGTSLEDEDDLKEETT